jgi:acyl-coenzyme A thioesterase PaaI-like protein
VRTPEPQPEWGPARSRSVQWWDPSRTAAQAAGRSGLEFMQALADGKIPPPPIAMLMRMWPTRVERGLAQFECIPDESAYNPIGVIHGALDAGIGYTSIDITVNYLRPVTVDSGTLVAVGRVTKPGRRVALAAAEIHDGAGRLVATASSNCLVFPL